MCKSFALLYGNLKLSVKAISVETALVVGVSMLSFDFLQAGLIISLLTERYDCPMGRFQDRKLQARAWLGRGCCV